MIYRLDFTEKLDPSAPFRPWQPSTWPSLDSAGLELAPTLQRIFECTILGEINNVISDAEKSSGSLGFRGHVVAIALMCALDAISSYGYGAESGGQIPKFVVGHFPKEYWAHAEDLLYLYRHAMIHSWNLFGAAIFPGEEPISLHGGTLCFGLKGFFRDLCTATENFLERLATDSAMRKAAMDRYSRLRESARAANRHWARKEGDPAPHARGKGN